MIIEGTHVVDVRHDDDDMSRWRAAEPNWEEP